MVRTWPPSFLTRPIKRGRRSFPVGVVNGSSSLPSVKELSFPFSGAALDIDFISRRNFWNGAEKTTADFTTFTLGNATLGGNGLTCGSTMDITIATAGIGVTVPGASITIIRHSAAPGAQKSIWQLDDASDTNFIALVQSTTPIPRHQSMVASALTADIAISNASVLNQRYIVATSYDTNSFLASASGINGTADVSGTIPTPTVFRIGRAVAATSNMSGTIERVILFTAVKTQAALQGISEP